MSKPMTGSASMTGQPAMGTRMGALRTWVLAARPATLTAAVVPVLVGTACAYAAGGFRPGPALAALLGAMFIQIGTNFANDVFDYDKGADDERRLGPTRVVQAGLLSARAVRLGMGVSFGLALVVGVYLTWVGGWAIVAIGVASILSGIAYTGGPFPLGYNGLGDPFVMIFFGFVAVCGTAFVQMGHVPATAWWAAAAVGALATAILVVNNVRDRHTDASAGKRTLAVRFGKTAGWVEYVGLLLMAYAVPFVLWAGGLASAWVLLPVGTAPVAAWHTRRLAMDEGSALNRTLAGTAKLLLLFGGPFALGLALGG